MSTNTQTVPEIIKPFFRPFGGVNHKIGAETDGHLMACGQACYPIDVAIAMDHLTLAATALGLGTCWIGSFDETLVKQLLGIPPEMRVVQLMPLGYPVDPAPVVKGRLALEEIVHRDRW